jgi:predicted nuclease with TOPRIM domain
MTDPTHGRTVPAPLRALRRVVAPAALELQGQLPRLREDNQELRDRLAWAEGRLGQAEGRLQQAEERLAALEDQARRAQELAAEVDRLREGLHEARRLNLRVAELTDLVTELVLPLHDREIDPAVLQRLGADTL